MRGNIERSAGGLVVFGQSITREHRSRVVSRCALIAGLTIAGAWPAFAVEPRPAPIAGSIVTVNGDESLRFVQETDWRV
ncbi:MAG TPA: hypothetical protein VFK49_07150, partial [Stellaceae bacterium]|nr:hypothetical protein [Stellaceae bacterium]